MMFFLSFVRRYAMKSYRTGFDNSSDALNTVSRKRTSMFLVATSGAPYNCTVNPESCASKSPLPPWSPIQKVPNTLWKMFFLSNFPFYRLLLSFPGTIAEQLVFWPRRSWLFWISKSSSQPHSTFVFSLELCLHACYHAVPFLRDHTLGSWRWG